MLKIVCSFLLATLLSGCGSTPNGPIFKQESLSNDGTSLVYVYRLDLGYFNQNAVDLNVFLNGKRISELPKNGYVPLRLNSGSHLISFSFYGDTPVATERIEVGSNKIYYLKLNDLRDQGALVTKTLNQISLVNDGVGAREIASTKLVPDFNQHLTR
jgi:hypothetical protein